ncbi:DNA recombination protein RmuC, partial [Klebsiella pneumoniae]
LSTEAAATQQRTAEHTASQTLASAQRMMDPVSQALRQLDQRLLAVEKERTESSASLKEQISGMRDLNESLRKETASLSTA